MNVDADGPNLAIKLKGAYWIARGALAAVWVHQGLVPKLLGPHPMEVQMLGTWCAHAQAVRITWWIGVAEVLFGLYLAARPGSRWPAVLSLVVMPVAFAVAVANGTDVLAAPFNVTALNGLVMAIGAIVLLLHGAVYPARPRPGPARLSGVLNPS